MIGLISVWVGVGSRADVHYMFMGAIGKSIVLGNIATDYWRQFVISLEMSETVYAREWLSVSGIPMAFRDLAPLGILLKRTRR